jgi:hypothetical protein
LIGITRPAPSTSPCLGKSKKPSINININIPPHATQPYHTPSKWTAPQYGVEVQLIAAK